MLEHDGYVVAQGCDRNTHAHAPIDDAKTRRYSDADFLWLDSSNSTDVSLHATRAYYDIHSGLKRAHPGLLLEVCNDGGRMVDFGSAAHGDYFSIVDSYDPLSNRQAFYDASHVLPSAMLETYIKEWPTPRIENFRYMPQRNDGLVYGHGRHHELEPRAASGCRRRTCVLQVDVAAPDPRCRSLPRRPAAGRQRLGWTGIFRCQFRHGRRVCVPRQRRETRHVYVSAVRCAPARNIACISGTVLRPIATPTDAILLQSGVIRSLPLANSSELIVIKKL